VSSSFELTGSETVYEGFQANVYKRTFRHEDGEEVEREVVGHPGAVAVLAHDEEHLWLVRQPREAVGLPDMLELPAGKCDVAGEAPLETAKRELAEEIGKAAGRWEHVKSFYTSPGFSDEEVHLYLATDLRDESAHVEENERIEVVCHALSDLDALIAQTSDSKTLIGLYELRRRLSG
jgi:ADP-ribose pyrophosphatase